MAFLSWDPRVDDSVFSTSGAYRDVVTSSNSTVPLMDKDAFGLYPAYQELYNKLKVARFAGIASSLIGSAQKPRKYPAIVRPVYNLYGMSYETYKITVPSEFEKFNKPGYFWSEFLTGGHFSWDLALANGDIKWSKTWIGQPHPCKSPGVMSHWATREASPASERSVEHWVESNLAGFTGMVNLETIGGRVIECHLRVGDSLYLGNPDLLQSMVDLYEKGTWSFQESMEDFYIIPIWISRNLDVCWPKKPGAKESVLDIVKSNFNVWSIEVEDDWPANPVSMKRIMFLGCTELSKGKEAASRIQSIFDSESYAEK